jgi:hypothetical protein
MTPSVQQRLDTNLPNVEPVLFDTGELLGADRMPIALIARLVTVRFRTRTIARVVWRRAQLKPI